MKRTTSLLSLVTFCAAVLTGTLALGQGFIIDNDGLININAFKLNSGNGSNDHDLNSATETYNIWQAVDGGATPPSITVGTTNYNLQWVESDTEYTVNYGGGGGTFGSTLGYATVNNDGTGGSGGSISSGDDFSFRADAYLAVPVGTWSIGIGADDGRRMEMDLSSLSDTSFINAGGQADMGGSGNDFVGYNGTSGHNWSVGVFTVDPSDVVDGTDFALVSFDGFFFERGSGDSFEMAIKSGNDTSVGGTGEGWSLLQDGALGWAVSSQPINVFFPTELGDRWWDGDTAAVDWSEANWLDAADGVNTGDHPTLDMTTRNGHNAFIPEGTINVTGAEGAFSLDLGVTNATGNATLNIDAGGQLTIQENTDIGATGSLNIDGTFSTANLNAATGSVINLNDGGTLSYDAATVDQLNVSGSTTIISSGTMNAASLSMADAAILDSSTNLHVGAATLGDGSELSIKGGSFGSVALLGDATINASGSVPLNNVNGAGGITLSGGGTFTMDDNNGYAGATIIDGAILNISNGGALGNDAGDTIVKNGGQLRLIGAMTIPADETITISGHGPNNGGAIYLRDGGVRTIAGLLKTDGETRIRVGAPGSPRLKLTGGFTVDHKVLVATDGTGEKLEIATTPMTGTGEIQKEGNGRIEAKIASPDYSGLVRVRNGYVEAWATNALGTGPIRTESDGTLLLRNGVTLPNNFTITNDGEGTNGAFRN